MDSNPQDPAHGDRRAPRPSLRAPWSEFREALDAAGFHPSRRLGQNFLLDDNMARAIAQDAGVEPGRFVLEVGPGCGFLSVHLADLGARLLCAEIDTRLAPIAARFLEPFQDAEVVLGDVLASKSEISPHVLERLPAHSDWTLCSNLPYSISGPFLATVAQLEHPPGRVCCLVQKEVAERLAAAPGTAAWGPLTAAFQETFQVTMGRLVPPQLFWPRPKVDSAVFLADLREDVAPASIRGARIGFYRDLLQRRRQGLRRVLGDMVGKERCAAAIEAAGLEPQVRAETLGLHELRALHAAAAG